MTILQHKYYEALRDATLENGEASLIIKASPATYYQLKNFFKNSKARDLRNKASIDRIQFIEVPQDNVLQVTMRAVPKYLIANALMPETLPPIEVELL